jgi:hypothetical protein
MTARTFIPRRNLEGQTRAALRELATLATEFRRSNEPLIAGSRQCIDESILLIKRTRYVDVRPANANAPRT